MSAISPDNLKNVAAALPPSPQVFGKLGKLLRDPGTDLSDITDLVNTDSSLTTRVLRLSNSAAFAQDLAIDNLDDAINRVGFREVFKLVGAAAASDLFASRNTTYGVDGSALWENSLASGLTMEYLAQTLGHDEQEYYTIGLLRSMGKLVIDLCNTNDSSEKRYPEDTRPPLLNWEEEVFSITSPSVSAFLLTSWNFPSETIDSIQNQYLERQTEDAPRAAAILNLASALAAQVTQEMPGESSYWIPIETQRETFGLAEHDIEDTLEHVKARLESVLSTVAS